MPKGRFTQSPTLAAGLNTIADPYVNQRRHFRYIDGRSLHDFVPLYWATQTPMQYEVQFKNSGAEPDNLVFFRCDSTKILETPGIWTTDGNAASQATQFFPGRDGLNHVDWNIVRCDRCYSREYKRKKAAEVLVPDRVSADLIGQVCVRYPRTVERIEELTKEILNRSRSTAGQKLAPVAVVRELYYWESMDQ